jgi:hypothetical protein
MPRLHRPPATRSIAQDAPLLVAPELAELARLAGERDQLIARIRRLAPNAHRRVILEDRLQGVVAKILRIEIAIFGGRS